MVEWRVYGCGSVSSSRSLQSSYELIDERIRLQVDFGNGALYRRCQAEGSIIQALDSIEHIYLTHSHPDHCADLIRFAVAWKYTPDYSPGKPVHLYATPVTLESVKMMLDYVDLVGYFEEIFIPHPVETGTPFELESLTIQPFPVVHIPGSAGIRIYTPDGIRIAFTGDTSYYEGIECYLRELDLLVTDTSFDNMSHPMHFCLEEVVQLAAKMNPQALLLVHFYPELEAKTPAEIQQTVAAAYPGSLFIAEDGLSLRKENPKRKWRRRKLFRK